VFAIASFALVATGSFQLGLTALVSTLALAAIGLPAIRNECRRYAIAQVRAIVSEPGRADQVRRAFDGVVRETIEIRRVA